MLKKIGRDNLLVMLSLLIWALGEGLWFNLRQILLRDLGATPQEIGLVGGIESAARMLLLIPTGYMIDRFGPRALMIGGWAIGIGCAALIALAPTWQALTVGLAVYATTAFVIPALSAYALMAAPPGSDPQRVLSVLYAAFPLGMVVSPALGGVIAGWLGSIRSLLWVAMGLYTLSTLVMALIRHIAPRPRDQKFHFAHLFGNRPFMGYVIYFALALSTLLVGFWLINIFMEETRRLPVETIGLLFSVFGIGTATLNLLIGRVNRRWSFPLALGVFWAAALILWQVSDQAGIGIGFYLMGAVYALRPTVLARLETVVKPEDRGMAFSVLEFMFALASALAATTAGQLYALTPAHDLPLIASLVAAPIMAAIWFGLGLGRTPASDLATGQPNASLAAGEN